MVLPRAAPALLASLVLLASTPGSAQIEPPRPVEELAPDTPSRPTRTRREPPPPPVQAAPDDEGTEAQEPPRPPPAPVRRSRAPAPAPAPAPTPTPAVPARDRTPAPPLLVPTEGDENLLQAFGAWKDAER